MRSLPIPAFAPRLRGAPQRPGSRFRGSPMVGVVALLVALATLACGAGPSASAPTAGHVGVVATTTVFGDLVAQVGGDLVTVTSLVPKGGDVHTYEPRPDDVRALARADLVVMNGLGLDDWLDKLLANAPSGTPVIRLAPDLPGASLISGEGGVPNPHLWLDVSYAEAYVTRIADALAQVDPAHGASYRARSAAYQERLAALDTWIRQQVASIPAQARRIVTFHDAFPYFARAYGITVVGVAVPAPGQDPSAGYTAQLIEAIRGAGVRAIFSEAQFPAKLVEQLAAETGTKVVADLYSDSLGDPPVTSYEAVMRWDVGRLVEALR